MKRVLFTLLLAFGLAPCWALPSLKEVQAQIQQGNYAQAETMMSEVVEAKPDNAKAHYIYAEVLAHNARFDQAAEQARKAQSLDPAISFTQPAKFREFEQLLEREQRAAQAPKASSMQAPVLGQGERRMEAKREHAEGRSGIPGWIWGGLIALAALLLWRLVSANRANLAGPSFQPAGVGGPYPVAPNGPYYGPQGGGYGAPGGYGAGPGIGGSALRTGMAVAGGMAAGALIDEMLHSNRGESGANYAGLQPDGFGAPQDDGAARELENRSVDFGSGGDWSDGGSTDMGGGGGGSDGW